MLKTIIYTLSCAALFYSCNRVDKDPTIEGKEVINFEKINYSQLFTIKKHSHYKEIVIASPWIDGEIYAQYILIPKRAKVPENLPNKAIIIRTPVDNIVTLSTPHIGLYDKLNALDKIIGIATADYVYNQNIKERTKRGVIKEVGSNKDLNIELLVDMNPDMVTTSGFQTPSRPMEIAAQAGIKVVFNIEWMEKSPLARAEWIKFAAAFINKEKEAQKIFDDIVLQYNEVKKLAENVNSKPKILIGKKWKGIWNTSGGTSYYANFLRDAGADYYWFQDTSTGTLELSFEEVIDKQLDTDIWINPGNSVSIADLLASDDRYGLFNPVKQGQVFGYFNKVNSNGVNAYWEKGPIAPHIILSDLIKIFHPDLLPNHELYFFKKLE